MIDWVGGTEDRNYQISKITGPQKLSELLWFIFALSMVAAALLFSAWIRSRIIDIGYQSQQLRAEEQTLLGTQKNLALEEQILKNPERIEGIARNELGMVPLRANQVITPLFQDIESPGSNSLALANASDTSAERGTAAAN